MEIKKITESKKIMTILVIVVLLIIAMVSYTYSFFTVTVTDNDSIVGAAASLGVDLTVTKIAPSNDVGLVPQLDDYITKAVIGRKGNCVDDNGNNVCQVYEITVKNTSAASVTLDGTLQLNARDNPNLKWAVISGITEPTLTSNINTPSERNLVREESYEANETKIYYIVLWISETNAQQFDTGDFTGVVTFKDSSSLYFTWVTTDIEGKTTVESNGEVFAYKISDMVPTLLEGATLTMINNASGEVEDSTLTVEDYSILVFDEEFIVFCDGFVVVTTAGYDFYGTVFPEAGVYVVAGFDQELGDATVTLDWTNGKELPAQPGPAPELTAETVTVNSVTLNTIDGGEYSMDGETWQDSPTFTGLNAGTQYKFYARYKATDTTVASEQDYVYVTTRKYDTEAPAVEDITVVEATTNSITLNTIEGAQYSEDGVWWQDSPVFTGLDICTEYTFYVRYKETNTTYASESVSVVVSTKKNTVAAPSELTAAEVTANSVVLNAIVGAEYSTDGESWQDDLSFTGLEPATIYTVYARYKETDTAYASESILVNIATLPLVEEITDSWETIAQSVKDGTYATKYKVGNYKPMTLTTGEVVNMQIVAVNADTKVSGGTAAISWLAMDLLNTNHAMNTTYTNENGWAASNLRSWLQGEVLATMPDAVKNNIVAVNKTYYDYTTKATQTCEDTVWIPSYREMYGNTNCEDAGAVYTGFFTSSASRVKEYNGAADYWWLRSAYSHSAGYFLYITSSGSSSVSAGYSGVRSEGVALGFCM